MSSSSSPAKPSSSSSAPKPSSSSAAKPSSSSAKPSSSSSSSGGSSSSSSSSKPTQATPYISANAWMSFFLFVCLVIIILQGPLGLSGGGMMPGFGSMGLAMGGLPGCGGYVAAAVPWCQPVAAAPMAVGPVMAQMMAPQPMYAAEPRVVIHHHQQQAPRVMAPQMGGQGYVASPNGGGGYSWYANSYPQPAQPQRARYASSPPIQIQYQRPGMQIQVEQGMLCSYFPYACQPLIPFAYANPTTGHQSPGYQSQYQQQNTGIAMPVPAPASPVPVAAVTTPPPLPGIANLESAFYPLLVGAIALLVIFDYAS